MASLGLTWLYLALLGRHFGPQLWPTWGDFDAILECILAAINNILIVFLALLGRDFGPQLARTCVHTISDRSRSISERFPVDFRSISGRACVPVAKSIWACLLTDVQSISEQPTSSLTTAPQPDSPHHSTALVTPPFYKTVHALGNHAVWLCHRPLVAHGPPVNHVSWGWRWSARCPGPWRKSHPPSFSSGKFGCL